MVGAGNTHKGKIRKINQDYIYINNNKIGILNNLYAVADGIGGSNAGEVASSVATEIFEQFIQNSQNEEVLDLLVDALVHSNKEVFELAKTSKDYQNMGTTFLVVTIKNNKIYIAHVGDCRLYGIRNNRMAQMTSDHTYSMELFKAGLISKSEAKFAEGSHILTRAVGTDKTIEVDALLCDVNDDDIFILCSDGLTDMVSDAEIFEIASNKHTPIESRVQKLIDIANEKGGKDNIAVIIIES